MLMSLAFLSSQTWQDHLRKGSGYLRGFFLIGLISCVAICLVGVVLTLTDADAPLSFRSSYWWNLTDALECWFAYRLFSYYARGEWFASRAIFWMKAIAALSLVRGGTNIWHNLHFYRAGFFLGNLRPELHVGDLYQPHAQSLVLQLIICAQYFLTQLLHNVVFGCVILFIAWIMDEGRKLQEEQELTV